MSRRVYEIARELDLDTKEVIGRLNEAGVEVKHHSASVEDSVYERVFGDEAQNGRSEAEHSGHGATVAAAPADEPIAAPREGGGKRREKKRRRVVIDASATNRGGRSSVAPAPPREPERAERAPVEEKPEE